jgi:hypothetical protein
MKKIISLFAVIILCFSSCKNECKTCTIRVFQDGVEQEQLETSETYCGEALDAIESQSSVTAGSIQRKVNCR